MVRHWRLGQRGRVQSGFESNKKGLVLFTTTQRVHTRTHIDTNTKDVGEWDCLYKNLEKQEGVRGGIAEECWGGGEGGVVNTLR